ncbi:peptidylprolyl isomerase [uncultured Sphingomonas sp.]|uniref:peptidylprolyl isomerase n=1 Tax=uncultured Sphingomonas sp. TaxID=158754 RepID=UPI003748182A
MMIVVPLLLALQATPALAAPHEPVASDWRAIPNDELLVMRLGGDRSVVIRLAATLAPAHVANIRKLASADWWDGESVYRVQENWVAQWGDATEKKPLPQGVAAHVVPEFEIAQFAPAQRMTRADTHSAASGVTADGWPIAGDGHGHAWLTHCYGMVGVARDEAVTSGSGAELFTPIGQSARRLDRNYAVVGRVIEGMQHLSALPRGPAPMGVHADPAARARIVTVTLASALPAAERPRYQYRAADNPRFAALIHRRENPPSPTIGSGGADVCEVPLEVRRAP